MTPRSRVTVVDDDPSARTLMKELLELEGYRVVIQSGATPNLRALIASRPDLVVLDLRLSTSGGDLSGWDVVRLARSNPDLRAVPILLVSADVPQLRTLIPAAMEYSDVLLLGKPFGLDSLSVMVGLALHGAAGAIPYHLPEGDATQAHR